MRVVSKGKLDDPPDEEDVTEIGEPPKEKGAKSSNSLLKKFLAPLRLPTISSTLADTFNTLAFLSRSQKRFESDEFEETARKLQDLFNMIPAFRVVIHLLGPITAIADIVRKFEQIREAKRTTQEPMQYEHQTQVAVKNVI